MTKPIVAIVGRPNVGKSTLFNRLVGRRLAIVDELPGTTRDRLYAEAEWGGAKFTVVDTGGILMGPGDLIAQVRAQAELAISEADVIIFVTDAIEGLTVGDEEVAEVLRRSQKPVMLAVNKTETKRLREATFEFYRLGLGTPYPISAIHGTGVGDLLDEVVASFPIEEVEEEIEAVKIAIVGRPNVGKSSLLNRLLGYERAIVHPSPGTTRDAIDTYLEWEGKPLILIDTAGIRKRGRIAPGVEKYSVLRALRAIGRSDVVLLIVDAVEGVTAQDAHIAGYILEEAKSVVVLVNKWDLIEKTASTLQEYTLYIRRDLRFLDYVPILFISAKTGEGVEDVLPMALLVREERLIRIPTGELNRIVQDAIASHSPPSKRGKRLRIYYATQVSVAPPTFIFFVNDPDLVHFSYERYLENKLREHHGFIGTPLRLGFRRRGRTKF